MRALLIALALAGCGGTTPEPAVVDIDACQAACENLRRLECPAGEPTPNGAPCETVCYQTEATGWTTSFPDCVARAASCEQAARWSAEGCGR